MKTKTMLVAALVAASLTACIPSVKPFYTANDVVYEAKIVGQWQVREDGSEPAVWEFGPAETNRTYTLKIREGQKEGQFTAVLFKLGTNYFFDLTPSTLDFASNQVDLVAASVVPGHLVAHVPQLEPELKIAFFDFDKLSRILKEQPQALAHHSESDRVVLTAEPKELQKFILEHLHDGSLFAEPGVLARVPTN